MSWRAITENDLLQYISVTEVTSLRAAAVSSNQPDPVLQGLINVTGKVRGYIAANPANILGPDGTLPEHLIECACQILVVTFSSRPGGMLIDPKGVRKEARDAAIELLKDVAAANFVVEAPATADTAPTDTPSTPSPSMSDHDHHMRPCDQEGI